MIRFGFASFMAAFADTVKHVRRIVVYNHQEIREA